MWYFFVVPLDALEDPKTQESYRLLKEKFTLYKRPEIKFEGYQPYLIITKADLSHQDFRSHPTKLYDDERLRTMRDTFCKKTGINENRALFIPNYVAGINFEQNTHVDMLSLFIANAALDDADALVQSFPSVKGPRPEPGKVLAKCVTEDCVNNGKPVSGKFCGECGNAPKIPVPLLCRTPGCPNLKKVITSKFCAECGSTPQGPLICTTSHCVNVGKEIATKFCAECGRTPSS